MLRAAPPGRRTVDALDFHFEGGGRVFGAALCLGPDPFGRGWLEGAELPGFELVVVKARPCRERATLWPRVQAAHAAGRPLAPLVSAWPTLTCVQLRPVYAVREFNGLPQNRACCSRGVFDGAAADVPENVEKRCNACGDCFDEDLEDLGRKRRRPRLAVEKREDLFGASCYTAEGLDDGAEAQLEVAQAPLLELLGARRPAAASEAPSVRQLLRHDSPALHEERARRALLEVSRAALELSRLLRAF